VGSQPSENIRLVLDAWEGLHTCMRAYVASVTADQLRGPLHDLAYGEGTVGIVLKGMAQHDLVHIRQAEAALKELSSKQVSDPEVPLASL
jgi:hypothetical protein